MSHSIVTSAVNIHPHPLLTTAGNGFAQMFTITIADYTAGGENFTLADFQLPVGTSVFVIANPTTRNSLSKVLLPLVVGGNLKLIQQNAGVLSEIPTTTALNAIIDILLVCSA